jgi:hypothetical protein
LRDDGGQERIAIGVGKLMSLHVRAMLYRLIHLETIVLHGIKVLHILEHHAFPVDPGLTLELQICLLSVVQLGLNKKAASVFLIFRSSRRLVLRNP